MSFDHDPLEKSGAMGDSSDEEIPVSICFWSCLLDKADAVSVPSFSRSVRRREHDEKVSSTSLRRRRSFFLLLFLLLTLSSLFRTCRDNGECRSVERTHRSCQGCSEGSRRRRWRRSIEGGELDPFPLLLPSFLTDFLLFSRTNRREAISRYLPLLDLQLPSRTTRRTPFKDDREFELHLLSSPVPSLPLLSPLLPPHLPLTPNPKPNLPPPSNQSTTLFPYLTPLVHQLLLLLLPDPSPHRLLLDQQLQLQLLQEPSSPSSLPLLLPIHLRPPLERGKPNPDPNPTLPNLDPSLFDQLEDLPSRTRRTTTTTMDENKLRLLNVLQRGTELNRGRMSSRRERRRSSGGVCLERTSEGRGERRS